MKKLKTVLMILLIITFYSVLIQANELILINTLSDNPVNENAVKINFNFIDNPSDELSNPSVSYLKDSKLPKSSGSVKNKVALIFGILMVIGGPCLAAGGALMIYFNAEGLHLFDDKTLNVYFWNNNNIYGWLGFGFGIAFTVLGAAILAAGICLIIVALVPNNRRAQMFMEHDVKNNAANIGFKIKI